MKFLMPIIIMLGLLSGCQQERDWGFQSGDGSGGGGLFPFGSNGGENNGGFGSGNVNPVDLRNDLDQDIDYPKLRFTGDGNITSIDDRNPTQIATNQEFSREFIRVDTTRFTSSDSTIDKKVRKLVGNTEFERTPKQELINREDEDNFKNLSFVMYVSRSKATNGYGANSLTYSSPVPAAIIPTDMVQYDVFRNGPISYSATVIDDGGARFNIISTLSETGRNGAIIKILHMTEIQGSDNDGRLYDKLHLSWRVEYEIDTAGKKVLALDSNDFYYNEKKGRRNMTAIMQLCAYNYRGQDQSIPPCPHPNY